MMADDAALLIIIRCRSLARSYSTPAGRRVSGQQATQTRRAAFWPLRRVAAAARLQRLRSANRT